MKNIYRIKVMPLLVIVAALSFSARIGDFFYGLDQIGFAYAQQEVQAEPPPLPKVSFEKKEEQDSAEEVHMPVDMHKTMPKNMPKKKKIEWRDAIEEDVEFSSVKTDLYNDLSKRRVELENRERQLSTREALLSAAEREVEQKLREMTTIKNEIESLLREQSEEEIARITSLVKIYEGMKAKDAARIFNTLDMDILIMVMSRMSERKSSPVLAEMTPDRARSVTILLARQKALPSLSYN